MIAKLLLVAFIAIAGFTQAEDPEDYPGQHSHAMPPEGWYCSTDSKAPAHKCSCHRMVGGTDCDEVRAEDPKCKTYCHADRCLCKVTCDVGGHAHLH